MSFEIDHVRLANPPRKSDQEAITAFWGIYRWPFKAYNRYTQLEGLEQTADETRTMAKALKYVINAKELGLSIDGGLGWLAGPDINQRVAERGDKLTVFGVSKFAPEPQPKQSKQGKLSSMPTSDSQPCSPHAQWERMLEDAGWSESELPSALQMAMENDQTGSDPLATNAAIAWDTAQTPQVMDQRRRRDRRELLQPAFFNHTYTATDLLADQSDEDLDEEEGDHIIQPAISLSTQRGKAKPEGFPLKPNDLTNAQREMLLEMEWAQNAFMQSWAIAIMDNHKTFTQIQKLNIARLPNRHLSILRREDFWDSLPGLKSLSLAIVPDWREVKKEATSWVQDTRVAPSQSVLGVYEILTQQISRREHIKTLHFEWLCGGEYAPGLFARNQHILAAPVVSNAMHMANRSQQHPVLALPHVEHLSLKNCWMSPHIMSRFLGPMRTGAIQSITLDSVSLTAMVPAHAQPNPISQAGMLQNAQNAAGHAAANNLLINFQGLQPLQNGQNAIAVQPLPVPTNPNASPDWLESPRAGSWVDIIDNITPGPTLADIRYLREIGSEPEAKSPTKLFKLIFTSCGYVRVPLDFDQTILDPIQAAPPQNAAVTKRINEIDSHMMKPLDGFTLGTIVNHIDAAETSALENAWNMVVGWHLTRPELAADAVVDGYANAGQGRFDGTIEIPQATQSTRFSP